MSYKILIVDDSKLARMAVSKLVVGLHPDWTRLEAANADEAIAMAADADIVLMDFNMPGRDGLEVTAQLLKQKPKMPLAIVSANHQVEIVERAHALGATFLSKPLAKDALEEFLAGAIDRIRAGSR